MESRLDQSTGGDEVLSRRFEMSADRDRLTDVFHSERRRLFFAAWRLLGNVEDAEDAVQDGLLSALRNLHRFEGRSQVSTWLTRIVMNAALMRLRSLRAHEAEPIDEPSQLEGGIRISELLVDSGPNPEEACMRSEQFRILNQGLKSLSRPQRRALSLRNLHGLTCKEVARVLGLSEGTVKSQVHRARRRLSVHIRSIEQRPALANLARA